MDMDRFGILAEIQSRKYIKQHSHVPAKVATNQNMVTLTAQAATLVTGSCQSEIVNIYH